PGDKLYTLRLATVERRLGQPKPAAERLKAAGAPDGFEEDWAVELGRALLDDKRPAEVVEVLGPFLDKRPDEAEAHALLGIAMLKLNDVDGAILHLDRSVVLAP